MFFRFALLVLAFISVPASAQTYPRKPVHIVVPFSAGGSVDVIARMLAEQLAQSLHQPFVIDNKPGAGSMIAGEFVARAAPDGYTLLAGSNSALVLAPLINSKPLYDPQTAFAPISSISFTPTVVAAGPALKAANLKEFFDTARSRSGGLAVTIDAVGSINQVASELLQGMGGVTWRNVHYRGNMEGLTDLLGGNVDAAVTQITAVSQYFGEGKLRPMAVLTKQRAAKFPDIPTVAEAGYTAVEASAFNGLVAPAKTPADIVNLLSETLRLILAKPDVQAKFDGLRVEARGSTPEEFQAFLREQTATWAPVVRAANIKVD